MSVKGWRRPSALLATSLFIALILLMAHPPAAGAQGGVAPSVDGLSAASRRIGADHCRSSICQADVIIAKAVQLEIAGASATVGRPHPIPLDRDARTAAAFRRLTKRSLPVAQDFCRRAAIVLSRFSQAGAPSDVSGPVAVIDLSSRLDLEKPKLNCTHTVISALPATPASETAIHNARALCMSSSVVKRCLAIVR